MLMDGQNAMAYTGLLEAQMDSLHLAGFSSFIQFPPPNMSISTCRVKIGGLVDTIADIFPDAQGRWSIEGQLAEFADSELDIVKDAYTFSKSSSSLFHLLVDSITCDAAHVARLHLSGFNTQRWEMLLGTGEDNWIPACFNMYASICFSWRF